MGYLVISRRVSERIEVKNGKDSIVILISDITLDEKGQAKVDIAIDAPKEFNIKRRSTHLEEQNNNGIKPRNKLR